MKIIHVTDTHFVKPEETLYGLDPRARLDACVADINLRHPDADLCVITGDLTQRGEPEAYASLNDCLANLQPPRCVVLGNHDLREPLLAAFPELSTDEHGFVQSVMDGPAGRLMFLDTVRTGEHGGVYCEPRLKWLEQRLEAARDLPVYLFMHHPPFPIGLEPIDVYGMRNPQPLARLIARYPNIRHLFCGHVHRPVFGTWQGIGFNALPSTNHQFWLPATENQRILGSQTSPAYAVALINQDTVIVHYHDFLDNSPKFDLFDPGAEAGFFPAKTETGTRNIHFETLI